MKRLTEEDTFRALSRAPHSEVRRLYDELYRTGNVVTQADESKFFESLGWSFRDFIDFIIERT
jgi:hypothetical protein